MNKKNIILSLFIGTLLTFVMPLCAQNQTVTGLVVDVSGEPIIGATVMVVNGTVGTVTDIDGKFNIGSYIRLYTSPVVITFVYKKTLPSRL